MPSLQLSKELNLYTPEIPTTTRPSPGLTSAQDMLPNQKVKASAMFFSEWNFLPSWSWLNGWLLRTHSLCHLKGKGHWDLQKPTQTTNLERLPKEADHEHSSMTRRQFNGWGCFHIARDQACFSKGPMQALPHGKVIMSARCKVMAYSIVDYYNRTWAYYILHA